VTPFVATVKQAILATGGGIEEVFVCGPAPDGTTHFEDLLRDGPLEFDYLKAEIKATIDVKKDPVVYPYSSGTTGLPKACCLTAHGLVANIVQLSTEGIIELDTNDVLSAVLPFFHIYGMVVLMNLGLKFGATIVVYPKFDPVAYLSGIGKYKVTISHVAPPIIGFLAKHPVVDKFDLSPLKELFCAAAPLGEDLARACQKRLGPLGSGKEYIPIRQGYGMTEMSPAATITRLGTDKPSSVGALLPNMEMKIVDVESKVPLPLVDEEGRPSVGEFWFRGPNIMPGYLNNPEATAETIDADGFLHTGDVGFMDQDGDCFIVDRCKELIKVKGFQVAPAELEDLLCGHAAVAAAGVVGIPDEKSGEVPKAFVQLQPGADKSEKLKMELIAWCLKSTTAYKAIAHVEFVDLVPKSASGKILRKELRKLH
jgi:acyl-CoA synthetase (AMP-forming)/AMP-acid ligase II